MPGLLHQWNAEMARVVEGVRRSLVRVSNGPAGAGAGTIWHANGLILTNAHVVRWRTLRVTLPDGQIIPARILIKPK